MADLQRLAIGHHRLPCPECDKRKHRPRDTALAVDITAEGGVYVCHRCGWAGGWRSGTTGRPLHTEAPRQRLTLATHWLEVWRGLRPITPNTTAHAYLTARYCEIPPADGDLRCTEALRHPSGYCGPALVALVTDAITREALSLHKTWIQPSGKKADVNPPRLLLGKHRKQGGVIRLWPDESVTMGLAIAEGIESALAVATAYTPVWSTIDAGNMAAFPVLEGIESLLIVADHDAAGLKAADECSERWQRAGREVRVAIPPKGMDACDLARKAA